MTSNELSIAFAEECLRWAYTKHYWRSLPDGNVCQFRWWTYGGGFAYGSRRHYHKPDESLPPFASDTPEGYAAFKRWVEPWIKEKGLSYCYDSGEKQMFALREHRVGLPSHFAAITYGPLPIAAIKAAVELVRKEKQNDPSD